MKLFLLITFLLTLTFYHSGYEQELKTLNQKHYKKGDKILVGVNYSDSQIYYTQGKDKLLLDSILQFLNKNDSLIVEIQNHTDSRGNFNANQKISAFRSKSLKYYLLNRGINESRLLTKGFGESQPLIHDSIIQKQPTKELKNKLHLINIRTYLVIRDIKLIE